MTSVSFKIAAAFCCVLALAANPVLDRNVLAFGERFWMGAVAVGLAVLGFCFVYRDAQFRETFRYTLQGLALAPLFFAAIRYSHWPIFRWLDWAPMRAKMIEVMSDLERNAPPLPPDDVAETREFLAWLADAGVPQAHIHAERFDFR